jgi:hypothetical protein
MSEIDITYKLTAISQSELIDKIKNKTLTKPILRTDGGIKTTIGTQIVKVGITYDLDLFFERTLKKGEYNLLSDTKIISPANSKDHFFEMEEK